MLTFCVIKNIIEYLPWNNDEALNQILIKKEKKLLQWNMHDFRVLRKF